MKGVSDGGPREGRAGETASRMVKLSQKIPGERNGMQKLRPENRKVLYT